jgi:FKBP-type peptidyl-prolyl cis-trans isomerase FklB
MRFCLPLIVAVLLMTPLIQAQEDTATDNSKESIAKKNPVGYFLGVSVGQTLGRQGFQLGDFDPEALAAGVADGISQADLKLSSEELGQARQAIEALLGARRKEMQDKVQQMAKTNKQKGTAWLAENKKKEGVKELAGGLQYKVLEEGDGASPSASDTVKVHYTGRFTNGEVFDSSVESGTPAEFVVGGVIKGWQMALQEMKVGSKWMLYIPPELAYGENGSPPAIGPNEVLVFEVELLEII